MDFASLILDETSEDGHQVAAAELADIFNIQFTQNSVARLWLKHPVCVGGRCFEAVCLVCLTALDSRWSPIK